MQKIKELSSEKLREEFKQLAIEREPIDSRRREIADELDIRASGDEMKNKIKYFFPSSEDRKLVFQLLKEELGY